MKRRGEERRVPQEYAEKSIRESRETGSKGERRKGTVSPSPGHCFHSLKVSGAAESE